MTALRAARCSRACPTPTGTGTANNYSTLQEIHERHRQGWRQDRRAGDARTSRCSAATAGAISTPFDQPGIPLPSGGDGNGTIYARNTQLVLGTTWVQSPTSLLEVRFGYS